MNNISLTAYDLAQMNVDISSVNICRQFRKFASSGNKIVFDRSEHHDNQYSRHLISYMESEVAEYNRINGDCLSLEDYLRKYIGNIQPYAIKESKLGYDNNNIKAIIDYTHRYPVYIKINKTPFDDPLDRSKKQRMIISFHEDYDIRTGRVLYIGRNNRRIFANHPFIPVIADDYQQQYSDRNYYTIHFPYSVGLSSFEVEISGAQMTDQGYFIVASPLLDREVANYCQSLFVDILQFSHEEGCGFVPPGAVVDAIFKSFSELRVSSYDLSFTSAGTTIQSILSFLIDMKTACMDNRFTGAYKPDVDYVEKASVLLIKTYLCCCGTLTNKKISEITDFLHNRYAPHFNNKNVVEIVEDIITQIHLLSDDSGDDPPGVLDLKEDWDKLIDTDTSTAKNTFGDKAVPKETPSLPKTTDTAQKPSCISNIGGCECSEQKQTDIDDTEGTGIEDPFLRSSMTW